MVLYAVCWFLLSIVIGYFSGLDVIPFALISFVIVCITGYIISNFRYKKEQANAKHMVFNEDTNSAKLLQRSETSASLLHIEQIQNTYTKYNPSKMVYTGATVGGVTTGGIHTTEAYLSTQAGPNSGRYHIYAKGHGRKVISIQKIELSKDLLKEAKECKEISKFIVGNELVLKYNTPDTKLTREEQEILKKAIDTFDVALQENITQRAFIASMLTKEDCMAIKKWVSGK